MSDTSKLNYSIGNKFYILGDFDNSISTEIIPFLGKEIENQIIDLRVQKKPLRQIATDLHVDYHTVAQIVDTNRKRGVNFPPLKKGYNRPTGYQAKSKMKLHKVYNLIPERVLSEESQRFEMGRQEPTTDQTFCLRAKGWKFHTSKTLDYIFND